jgi:hypothetical protein
MKKLKLLHLILLLGIATTFSVNGKEYHVSPKGDDANDGSPSRPFKTIMQAVRYAYPGDVITVHSGTYREQINPLRGGESDDKRIVYRAAPGEKVEIKGSEIIKDWKKEKDGVWKVMIPNEFFGDYNPYKDLVHGDWFNGKGRIHHTGEVFLNGKSLFEMETLEKVLNPVPWPAAADQEGSTYTWFCESDDKQTTIWANFHKFDPNKEIVEISTRPTCFYPEKPGINYLTISGFHFSQAATQWGAPTAEQVGMVATHWNKGWIIENNIISDTKCSGITLGKERGTGHNVWTEDKDNVNRDGNIHYIEVTFNVLRNGWNRENIGSHIVRNNTIYNCEQTGMCGSMGPAFCTIENNHIYNIHVKKLFDGAEIGGIKFHAPVDTQIRNNRIHNCTRGIWLDWMTQGTRVTGNLLYSNLSEDLFVEVNHGPYLVDNNIMLSPVAVRNQSQGGAYVHNLIAGLILTYPEPNRFTPYFLPHSTDMKALTTILAGDDRYYNNIFTGPLSTFKPDEKRKYGLEVYNESKLPVWINSNVYYNGANPHQQEENPLVASDWNPNVSLEVKGENLFLHLTLNPSFLKHKVNFVTTGSLGKAKIPKALFENPDGTPLIIDRDYFGRLQSEENLKAGPFSGVNTEKISIKIW